MFAFFITIYKSIYTTNMRMLLTKRKMLLAMAFSTPFLFSATSQARIDTTYGSKTNVLAANENFPTIEKWLTDPAKEVKFQQVDLEKLSVTNGLATIKIDKKVQYQSIDGFGYTLTGGSAELLQKMSPEKRTEILTELFASDKNNIGVSYLRLSIGASDLDGAVFSYNDLPAGETDLDLKKFDLSPDEKALVPILKEILQINPKITFLGSPWSPPTWMKDNNSSIGGKLLPKYYKVYSEYLAKYIKGMAAHGVRIDAITPQNEPMNPKNNPSLLLLAREEKEFVKILGSVFKSQKIKTKIIIWDHNCDMPEYPIEILKDKEAYKVVDGTGFHLYGGKISILDSVHNLFPKKNLYFTEQWVGAPGNLATDLVWHVDNVIIGSTRNWSKNALEWNLAADPELKPHTPGGCTQCLGAITLDGDKVTRNSAYYIIAHASKFVRPDAVRIASNTVDGISNVAFKTKDGYIVLIALNKSEENKTFAVSYQGKSIALELGKGAVATYRWKQ